MTKVDPRLSRYVESVTAESEFDREELRHCRQLLRRLQFLEHNVRVRGGMSASDASGGAAFAEWEMAALEWALTDLGYLGDLRPAVSGNHNTDRKRK